jgi:signal transduction histidine kinase/CheY-like chemotaxis protein
MPEESSAHNNRLIPYLLIATACVLPLLGLGTYVYLVASQAIEEDVQELSSTSAEITSGLVENEFEHWIGTLQGLSELPGINDAVRARDEEEVRRRLEIVVSAHPSLDRAFVADKDATLWSDYPRAPESLGKSFADREWYKGVSAKWEPYVSGVYRRNAEPRVLLVAVAVPIRHPQSGEVLAILVGQVRLEALSALLKRVEVGEEGYVIVLDHNGAVAGHPRLNLQERVYMEYAESEPVNETDGAVSEYADPVSGEVMLAAAARCEVPGGDWTAITQLPAERARAPVRLIGAQVLIACGLMLAVAVGFGLLLMRDRRATQHLNRELDRLNARLSGEVQEVEKEKVALSAEVADGKRNLADAEERLAHAQKMEAVGRLAGGVAHDFNNILSVIIGYTQFVLDSLPQDSGLRADITEIRDAGERAASLTRQLLAFSRKQVLQPVVLDINEVVGRMDKMLKRLIGEDVQLVTRLGTEIGRTRADPGQLEQIIVNLAVNARDAMPRGGKLTIETGMAELDETYVAQHPGAQPGPHVYFALSDTGIGMDAATREKIFEPFFTTKEMGRGTGLGLSTVYGIVKQSGGAIWVYSEPGRGTTFKVYLPEVQDSASTRKPKVEAGRVGGSETLLVVEDEPGVRRLVQQVLKGAGYKVLLASSGEEAIGLFGSNGHVSMLLTDVVLPVMGGPQIAKALKEKQPALKVLYMSGYTDNAIVHHGVLDAGVNFLEKPLRPDALLQKVRSVLDQA